jgi:hypothetical protein
MKGSVKKGKPRGLRRDRDCYTCRERNVKCDLNRPACTPCVEANLNCAGYPARLVWSTEKNQRSFSTSRASVSPTHGQFPALVRQASQDVLRRTTSTPLLPKIEQSSSPQPREYSHFQWGVKAIQKARDHSKSTMDQQAAESKVKVLDTVWKFVESYLESTNSKPGVSFELRSLQLKANAIEELKHCINQGMLEAVFATLAFTYFDVSQGSFGLWHQHLQGARSLLDLHCSNKPQLQEACKNLPGLQHAVTLLTWYDITGVIASIRANKVCSRALIFEDWHREVMDKEFFDLVGCTKHTFDALVKVVKSGVATPRSIATFLECLDDVLSSNDVPLTTEPNHANMGWKYTCLLTTINHCFPQPVLRHIQDTLVSKICILINSLIVGSTLYKHFALPVFVAAMNASNPEHLSVIRSYWEYLAASEFPLYPDALGICESHWDELGILSDQRRSSV